MSFPIVTRPFVLDVAGPDDNDEICALFKEVHLSGELDVNQERDPDFFALSRLHHGTPYTFLAREHDGRAAAIASVILRPAWFEGERITTGYTCDLRVRPGFRGGASLASVYRSVLEFLREEHGATLFSTVVFDDNQAALKVLTGPGAVRRRQPTYRPMTPFSMTSVQFTRPHRGPRRPIERGRPEILAELEAFLTARGKQRLLGEDFSDGLLQRRLADWPEFDIGHFYLARDGSGRIAGCLAPWNTASVKRTRVLGYHGKMLWVKRFFNAGAAVLRYPALPQPGGCFDFAFLTHLEVVDDDPEVLRDLLRAAYRDLRPTGLHFMSALVPRGSRLGGAFRGFMVQHTEMTLYGVHLPETEWADRPLETLHPGFEMALS